MGRRSTVRPFVLRFGAHKWWTMVGDVADSRSHSEDSVDRHSPISRGESAAVVPPSRKSLQARGVGSRVRNCPEPRKANHHSAQVVAYVDDYIGDQTAERSQQRLDTQVVLIDDYSINNADESMQFSVNECSRLLRRRPRTRRRYSYVVHAALNNSVNVSSTMS